MTTRFSKRSFRASLVAVASAAALVLSACAGGGDAGTGEEPASEDIGLMTPGTLVVGMNLQYKPQMYLENGEPTGYDVDLLNELADALGVELDIQNLDFNGLIPGLQSKQFDMVSVGFGVTEEREKVISFTRGYVPYATILAVAADSTLGNTIEDYNKEGITIMALQGSTSEELGKETFPNATITALPDQNAALLEVASGRADAIIVEDVILTEFNKSNGDLLRSAELAEPLSLYYGSWAVQKDNDKLIAVLDEFLCTVQEDGTLEKIYQKWLGPTLPAMPAC